MGLSSSKHNATTQSQRSSSGCVVRDRSHTACLGSKRFDVNGDSHDSECLSEENGINTPYPHANKPDSPDDYQTDQPEQTDDELNVSNTNSGNTRKCKGPNTSRTFYSRSLNASGRFLSRFSLRPGNISFRLTRSSSLNSWRSNQACFSNSNEEDDCVNSSRNNPTVTNENRRGCDFLPSCFVHRSPRAENESGISHASPDCSNDFQNIHRLNSLHRNDSRLRDDDDTRISTQEPAERRFSRTLSVGRLRDRVLRGSPISSLDLHSFQQDRELGHARQFRANGPGFGDVEEAHHGPLASSSDNTATVHYDGSQNQVYETTPRARRTRYHDLMEYRSSFMERRRRIRSQVRALQRLGSRFENLPAHERSCILSGQHRSGRCTCHASSNSNDDANARASISRIVMLAEALFEVLDEIHQQSAVLSSRSLVSSIGSVPAPNEVVDSLPLKVFRKLKKMKTSEDAAQCYICLVEYEDGDCMRKLPCDHEFHRSCVDKWLKEIHRVCPLCRGDICQATQ